MATPLAASTVRPDRTGFPAGLVQYSPYCITAIRILLGIIIMTHGREKLWLVGGTVERLIPAIAKIGFPAPTFFAYVVVALETVGALAFACGLFTRAIALLFVIQMTVIIFGIHWPNWYWTQRGIEYPLLLLALFATYVVHGSGPFALDRVFGRKPT